MEARRFHLEVLSRSEVAAASAYGIRPLALHARTREPLAVFPRHMAMYLAVERGVTIDQVRRYWHVDQNAVRYAVGAVRSRSEIYASSRRVLEEARRLLEAGEAAL